MQLDAKLPLILCLVDLQLYILHQLNLRTVAEWGMASLSVPSKPKMFSDKMTARWQKADDISFHRFFSVSFIKTNIKQDLKPYAVTVKIWLKIH